VSATAAGASAAPKKPRMNLAGGLTAVVRPLAVFTKNLSPSVRQTIAYAAVVTLFQAACLWGFLAFKGPAGELEPTSESVILRKPGDPPAGHDAHAAPSSGHGSPKPADAHGAPKEHGSAAPRKAESHAKPAKATAKSKAGKDAHADAGHH